jgi:hypothetical protein
MWAHAARRVHTAEEPARERPVDPVHRRTPGGLPVAQRPHLGRVHPRPRRSLRRLRRCCSASLSQLLKLSSPQPFPVTLSLSSITTPPRARASEREYPLEWSGAFGGGCCSGDQAGSDAGLRRREAAVSGGGGVPGRRRSPLLPVPAGREGEQNSQPQPLSSFCLGSSSPSLD